MNTDKDKTTENVELYDTNDKGVDNMSATINIERPCTIQESIIQSCKEVSLMRQGKLPKRSWKDFAETMRKEIDEDKDK